MKKIIALLAAAAVVALAGCNTVAGMGKDVEATGSAVETTANKAKPN